MSNNIPQVMIVDDDKFLLNMYSIKFTKNGFEVNAVTSGEEALKKIREGFSPDIVLLDVVMPVMDGFEILATIRKENLISNSSIIMLTNQGQLSDIEKAKTYNVAGYIIKATTIPSEVVEEVTRIYNLNKKS